MTRSALLRCAVITCLTLIALTVTVRSQTGSTKRIRATKGESPVIDGRLDDPAWKLADCWIAEMEIPYSQLRFSRADVQVWGINFNRWTPERNEDPYWKCILKNETGWGWASRFGELTGLEGIAPSRRLELLPYSARHGLVQYGEAAGTTIAKNADGSYSVTDNGNSFSIGPEQGFYGDFGFRSFRSSVVLRWVCLPVSTAYFVWQRNLEKQEDIGRLVRPSTFFDGFTGDGSDIVASKIAYWIPVS